MAKLFSNKDIQNSIRINNVDTSNVSLESITDLSLDVQSLNFKIGYYLDGLEASVEEFSNIASIKQNEVPGVFMQAAHAAGRRLGVDISTISTESLDTVRLSTEGLLSNIWEGIKKIIKKVVDFVKTMWDKFLTLIGIRKKKIIKQLTTFEKLKEMLKLKKKVSKEDLEDSPFSPEDQKEFQALREQLANFKGTVEYKQLAEGLKIINNKAPELMDRFDSNDLYKFFIRDKGAIEVFFEKGVRIYSLFGLTISEIFTNKASNSINAMKQKYTSMKKLMHNFALQYESIAAEISIKAAKDPAYHSEDDKELEPRIKKCHDISLELVNTQLANLDVELKDPSVLEAFKNNPSAVGFLSLDTKAEVGDIGNSKNKIIGTIEVFPNLFNGNDGDNLVTGVRLKNSVISRIDKELDAMWNVSPDTNMLSKNLDALLALENTVKELGFVLEDLEKSTDHVFDKVVSISSPDKAFELEMSRLLKLLYRFLVSAQSVIKAQYSGSKYILDVYDMATKMMTDYAEVLVNGK